ncbi:MAG: hypothetical protein PHX68_01150 [Alphaproteobacteria bacterium]|nr:hypothetical protein [Alphaproteobacteria bacterium]
MATGTIEQEKNYQVFKNAGGDIMFLIRARLDDAKQPKIVYDGGEHALFYRRSGQTIIFDFIHPGVRDDLKNKSQVLIVEARDGSIVREYVSVIKSLKEVPVPADIAI